MAGCCAKVLLDQERGNIFAIMFNATGKQTKLKVKLNVAI
jgi:hypothetical protein